MLEYIFPQDLVQTHVTANTQQQQKVLNQIKDLNFKEKIAKITIPPKLKIEEALLAIPFEEYTDKLI